MSGQNLHWHWIRFRLLGNLHVGSGRWGYVLPSRQYVPGWTLWGALTVMMKRKGMPGGYEKIGEKLNHNFWLGHFYLCRDCEDCKSYWLPRFDNNRISFCWQNQQRSSVPPTNQNSPMVFRHGVVRGSTKEIDSQGRLFLSETVKTVRKPFGMEGYIACRSEEFRDYLPEPGDRLSIGGNRLANGAELIVRKVMPVIGKSPVTLQLHHLQLPDMARAVQATGNLERIVLRRTRDTSKEDNKGRFRGFGQHFVDWGDHLAPGWEMAGAGALEPVFGSDGYRHGTVRLEGD